MKINVLKLNILKYTAKSFYTFAEGAFLVFL